jgi:EAL domain-containing protein (putative c-di-GMP-specific phosphodiesterase class I)
LSYLKQFPIDRLKIDRAFVNGVKTDAQDRALTTAITMADSMDLKVTAEGIETAGQLQFLDTLRCGEAQGFFLSRPLTASKAEVFLRDQLNGNDDKVLLKSA